jgi:transcriptional regulator with XRE-family HTH domain
MSLGHELRVLRLGAARMSLDRAASALGMSPDELAAVEDNTREPPPSVAEVRGILTVYGVPDLAARFLSYCKDCAQQRGCAEQAMIVLCARCRAFPRAAKLE